MAKTTKKSPSAKRDAATVAKKTTKRTASKKTNSKKTNSEKAATAKKPAVAKKAATKKKVTKKKVAVRSKGATQRAAAVSGIRRATVARRISAAQRHQLIAEAAYLRSEAQGFFGDAREDWLVAEAEVDARLGKAGIVVDD